MNRSLLWLLVPVIILALHLPAMAQSQQLVVNGGFESWDINGPGGPPDHWSYGTRHISAILEDNNVFDGHLSAKVLYDTAGTLQFNYETISVVPSTIYSCSLWVYDNNSSSVRMRPWFFFNPAIPGGSGPSTYSIDTAGWKLYVWSDSARFDSQTLTLQLRFYGGTYGRTDSIWVDDVVLWGQVPEIPPTIGPTIQTPSGTVYPTDTVRVQSTIIDPDGVIVGDSFYTQLNGGGFVATPHDSTVGNNYFYHISPNPLGTVVDYYIVAIDDDSSRSQSQTFSYTVSSAPNVCTGSDIFTIENSLDPGQDTASCWPSPYAGQAVSVCGIVTAVRQATYPSIYLQDQNNTAWGGIYLYDYTLASGDTVHGHIGDHVQVNATVTEYYGWTELDTLTSYTVLDTSHPLPETSAVNVATFTPNICSYTSEPYESELVRFTNVTVRSAQGSSKFWITDASTGDSIRIANDLWIGGSDIPSPLPATGMTYDRLIGVIRWEGRNGSGNIRGWILLPRFASDYHQLIIPEPNIVDVWSIDHNTLAVTFDRAMDTVSIAIPGNYSTVHGLTITGAVASGNRKAILTTDVQPDNFVDSLVVTGVCDSTNHCMTMAHQKLYHSGISPISLANFPFLSGDTAATYNQILTVKGIIEEDTSMTYYNTLFMGDQSGPPYNGVELFLPAYNPMPHFGDTVTVSAYVSEYFGQTELINALSLGNLTINYLGPTPSPIPQQVTTGELLGNGEGYEGLLVTLCDSFVVTNTAFDAYGFLVRSLSTNDSLIIHKQAIHTRYSYAPTLGDRIVGLTGVYRYQRNYYRLQPRTDADFNSFQTWCGAPSPGTISGIVTDQNSNPLADVIDSVFNDSNALLGVDTTDVAGAYLFTLDPGTFHIKFVKAGYRDTTIDNIIMNSGQAVTVNVQMFLRTGTINGVVTDQSSAPLAGVIDSVFDGSNALFGVDTTDVVGAFSFTIDTGTYHVKLVKDGYRDTTIDNIIVHSGQTTTVVVQMTVSGGIGCPYIPGDINGNHSVNGVDIVYAVNYLKGGLPPPTDCYPDCPLTPNPFYAAGDVNGNCAFNGIDITFFVRYLKLQVPSLLSCTDCPPVTPLIPAVMPRRIHQTKIDGGLSQ